MTKARVKKLTAKQENFCQQYLITGNASEAYRLSYNAGKMKNETINQKACHLLKQEHVTARVDELKVKRNERCNIDADYVLNRLVEIDQMDVADILEDDGAIKPVRSWPKVWRQFISGMDLSELWEGKGEDREMVGFLKKIKWPDKIKNLELIGKHIEVQAFREKVDHSSDDGSMSPDGLTPEQRKNRIAELERKIKEGS